MNKETIKIVIIGHVDHGKSTLIGRLLLDTDSLSKEKLAEIRKISSELGKDTELAYLADQLKEEREKNVTIDTTQIFFKTCKRNYVIIDAPGHVEFIKNMITGASLAEAAVLIVDVNEGVMEQTRRHLYLVKMLGLENIVVVFNKMDLVGYERERFLEVKRDLSKFTENLKIAPIGLIPISAKEGANILKPSKKTKWYKAPALLEILDSLKPALKTAEKPMRFPVQDIYEIEGSKVIVGKVASGVIKEKDKIVILPSFAEAGIKSIKSFGEHKKEAGESENIGLILDRDFPVKRGDVIVRKEAAPKPTRRFRGDIFWMSDEPLLPDRKITLRCATQEVDCKIEKIEKRIDSSTLEIIEEDPKELKLNEVGIVTLKTEEPILVEKFSHIEELDRFIIERDYSLLGAGIIAEGNQYELK